MSVDQGLVRDMREEVADLLAQQRRDDATSGIPPMSPEDERQFARALIGRVLEQHARAEIAAGRSPLNAQEEEEVSQGIHAALFGVGRLQPLLDNKDVENIDINGYDNVFIQYADGREERGAPVAESDEELIELVQVLGSYSGLASRPFDSANPQLDLRLPDGSRLSAVMEVCSRPSISVRRARLDRRRHERWEDHLPARPGQRDPARGAPHHRRARSGAGPGRVRGPAPQRRRLRGAPAQLRGLRRDLHGGPGAALTAHDPLAGHRR